MSIHGVDISVYQKGWKPASNDSFVFIKASEGHTVLNAERSNQVAAARAKGLQVGFYHYLHAGNIDLQAKYFVDHCPIQDGDLLACDWEFTGVSNADKDAFIKAVKKLVPTHKVGLYCNTNWWRTHDTTSYAGDFLWIANYNGTTGIQTPVAFWQYSDKPIDQNTGYFDSLAALKAWSLELTNPVVTPPVVSKPTTPEGGSVSIPSIESELTNAKVNSEAELIWREALAQFPEVKVVWCYSSSTDSDHRNGRCLDLMVTYTGLSHAEQVKLGDRIRAYFVANADRLHVQGIIWNGYVTGFPIGSGNSTPDVTYRGPAGQARVYSEADKHTDHIHVQVSGAKVNSWLKPTVPWVWDGTSFPGADKFFIGANGAYVTYLGQRLVVHGWTGYSDGPGPDFSATDQAGVKWFQEKQGWTGSDADGFPGSQTWALLVANPVPVVAVPIPAVPPVMTPSPSAPVGISEFVGVSFNAEWPGFQSTAAKAEAWSKRRPIIVGKVKAQKPKIILTQEMGQAEAAQFYADMGEVWNYIRFGPLNTVGWSTDMFTYTKEIDIDTPDYGQYPGRGYVEAWLTDHNGNRLRIGSGHNPVKTAADFADQEATIRQIVTGIAKEGQVPLIWGEDTNSSASKTTGMWAVLKKYGYAWITNGIDAVFSNYGAVVTKKAVVDLGAGSDHDMLVFTGRTTKA